MALGARAQKVYSHHYLTHTSD